MKLPFVSRARFEDVRAEVSELKAERKILLDRIMQVNSLAPIYEQPVSQPVTEQEHGEPTPPVRGRITMASVKAFANSQAEKNARKGVPFGSPTGVAHVS